MEGIHRAREGGLQRKPAGLQRGNALAAALQDPPSRSTSLCAAILGPRHPAPQTPSLPTCAQSSCVSTKDLAMGSLESGLLSFDLGDLVSDPSPLWTSFSTDNPLGLGSRN